MISIRLTLSCYSRGTTQVIGVVRLQYLPEFNDYTFILHYVGTILMIVTDLLIK